MHAVTVWDPHYTVDQMQTFNQGIQKLLWFSQILIKHDSFPY